jgi:hypothetical protein
MTETEKRIKEESDQKEAALRLLTQNEAYLRYHVAPLKRDADKYLNEAVLLAIDLNRCGRPATKDKIIALLQKYHQTESIASRAHDYLESRENARKNKANQTQRSTPSH